MSTSANPSQRLPLHWVNILFLGLTPIAAAILVPFYFMSHGWHWGWVPFFVIGYCLTNMSITCGYHRYFAHRTYETHPVIQWLYIFIGAAAFQGPVLVWSIDHRRHHLKVDTNDDPYSINKGFWYAHIGWMFHEGDPKYAHLRAPDLEKNKWIMLQHKYYPWIATFMGFIVPGLIAWALGLGFWGGVIIGGALRIVLTQHSTFFINSACHFFGRQPYTDKNTARDSLLLAILTFGEGYHNYHHLFQADYRNGVKWYEWDPTKWWIRSLAFFGLASRLKRVPKEEILKARLQMDERRLIARGACIETVVTLKTKVEEAQSKLRQMRDEYDRLKASMGQSMKQSPAGLKYKQMKADFKKARQEFRYAYRQWLAYNRSFQAVPVRY